MIRPNPAETGILTRAIVRTPGRNFGQGLTTAGLGPPDIELMLAQHEAYVRTLGDAGLEVIVLEPLPAYPDAYFVEDTAVVLPELAVIARPGAAARRGEEDSIEPVLARYRPTARITPPGTLDGGDVLVVGKRIFIGLSSRTNAEGAAQLGRLAEARGYAWTKVPVTQGLHLKSLVNILSEDTLILTRSLAESRLFQGLRLVIVDPAESYAANSLSLKGKVIIPAGAEGTRRLVAGLGLPVISLDVSEARKMDGGLSCLSLRF